MATYDIALFKGHGTGRDGIFDCGAAYNGITEFDTVSKIVDVALKHLKAAGLSVLTGQQNYKDKLLAGHTIKNKCAYSVHINAGGGKRSETFVPLNEKYFNTERGIQAELAKLGIPNGGVKSREYNTGNVSMRSDGVKLSGSDYYKEIRDAWALGVSLTILEVGFIDSSDITVIRNNIEEIGFIIAKELGKLCGKTITKPVPAPAPTTTTTGTKYRVVCGTYANKANAVAQQEKLKKAGFDSFLLAI